MLTHLTRYWKAGAAAAGSVSALWTLIAADRAISFEEIGVAKVALVAAWAALITALSPKNRQP